jgi:hypothetical protein
MAGLDVGAILVAIFVIALSVLVMSGRSAAPGVPHEPRDAVVRARGRTTAWRVTGLALGMVSAALLLATPPSWLGLGSALAGPALAFCLLAGVIAGELLGRAPAGVTRTAVLEVRSPLAFVPRRLLIGVAVTGGVLAALLSATSAVASSDDQGRVGRALTTVCNPEVSSTVGPWPGVFYSGPIAASVLIGLLLAGLAARAIARRPRPGTDGAGRAVDDELRRTSGRAITAAAGVLVTVPLAGTALFAGHALVTVGCGPTAIRPLGLTAFALAVVAAASSAIFAAMLVVPARASGAGA